MRIRGLWGRFWRLAAMATAAASISSAHAVSKWAIDPARTHIGFTIDAVGFPRTQGDFRKFEGALAVDLERPERSHVAFRVEAASVEVGSPSFSAYVSGEALLNAPRFPTIAFVSTSVCKIGERTVRVIGDLTMLGVTRPLEVDVDVERRGGGGEMRLAFAAKAKIDRLEFGMNSGFPVISREVDLTIASEGYPS